MGDIIVIGYRIPQQNNIPMTQYSSKPSPSRATAGSPYPGDTNGTPVDAAQAVAVNGTFTNPANETAVRAAAERLAEALIQLKQILESSDQSALIALPDLNIYVTVGSLLFELNNTNFTVTDQSDFQDNKGVGSAVRGVNGSPNTEFINYNAITGPNGYGASTYQNNAGLIGIMLHELAHMTSQGDNFWKSSIGYQKRDPTTKRSSFYSTVYGTNLEAFANDLMNAAAGVLKVDLQGMLPAGRKDALLPSTIYNSHVPPSQQE